MPAAPRALHAPPSNLGGPLRVVLLVDGLVFLAAAIFNFGVQLTIGSLNLGFPVPIWQAGIGEFVIGLALVGASLSGSGRLAWVAFVLSVAGIAFGLSSSKVQGPAREIHIVLVPIAIVLLGLLSWERSRDRRAVPSEA